MLERRPALPVDDGARSGGEAVQHRLERLTEAGGDEQHQRVGEKGVHASKESALPDEPPPSKLRPSGGRPVSGDLREPNQDQYLAQVASPALLPPPIQIDV